MLVVLWSTPRTGSTSYSLYLSNLVSSISSTKNTWIFNQYLNQFHYKSYVKRNYGDFIYHYEPGTFYHDYQLSPLEKSIKKHNVIGERKRNPEEEEAHRIKLLDQHNFKKYSIVIHQHVQPMTQAAYDYLKNKADRNIFLYRENLKDQLASYALSMHSKIFHRKQNDNVPIFSDVKVDKQLLKNLTDRVIYWHSLDKSGCEIVKYEDIKFDEFKTSFSKLNVVPAIQQLHPDTVQDIYDLDIYFQNAIRGS